MNSRTSSPTVTHACASWSRSAGVVALMTVLAFVLVQVALAVSDCTYCSTLRTSMPPPGVNCTCQVYEFPNCNGTSEQRSVGTTESEGAPV